ncbi:MAG: N-acetylmuramoyl-L-alanine amidase [Pedosphaera sp.]|nr:N-acetylmuramoyl-L-alanine amidase [Pedosphaera sp.]
MVPEQPEEVVVAQPAPIVLPKADVAPAPVPQRPPTPTPAPPPTNHFTETWIPLDRWSRMNGFGAPHRLSTEVPPAYSVTTSNGAMTIRIGSQLANWHGLEYRLGFAPELINGHPSVHYLDVTKNFEPLLNHLATLAASNRAVVIDPGHGGTDVGTVSVYNGHFEKEYALDLARRLQGLLVTNGWNVFLTRTNDQNVTLSSRVAFAEQHKADLFLSLHFNSAAPDREQAGLETYCLTPPGMHSNLTRGFYDNPTLVFPNNSFDTQNLQYAVLLHRALLGVNGNLDRGVRRARFLGVLQGQNRPAVLVEGGYLSNPTEARKIADPDYRQKLAVALAAALTEGTGAAPSLANHSPATQPQAPDAKVN